MKLVLTLLITLIGLFLPYQSVFAISDPFGVPNNKYGIHIADTNDIPAVSALVNSSGGDWGYVTLVIPDSDMNTDKWQGIFDTMRQYHLIPIVRIATHPKGDTWVQPKLEDSLLWAKFLDSLLWPVANRYVIIFNEPNHAKEWGGVIDPAGYARILRQYAMDLKNISEDFFVLPAGFDTAAISDGNALDAGEFIRTMIASYPDVFTSIDGWVSHSYPNPNFSGTPYALGKGTISSFLWELSFLRGLGVTNDLPLFITETGWMHQNGISYMSNLLSVETVAQYITSAADGIWQNHSIVAITPFVYNYQSVPFDHFSWKKIGSEEFYAQYVAYKNITKVHAHPYQHESYATTTNLIPDTLVTDSTYIISATIKNNGQAIVDPLDGYKILVETHGEFEIFSDTLPYIKPGQSGTLSLRLHSPSNPGNYDVSVYVTHAGRKTLLETKTVTVVPPPSMTVYVNQAWQSGQSTTQAKVIIYDSDDVLIHTFPDVLLNNGTIRVEGLRDIIPSQKYRIVIVIPYYLPRQTYTSLSSSHTDVQMKRLLPLDFSNDGALTAADIISLIQTQPRIVFSRFF